MHVPAHGVAEAIEAPRVLGEARLGEGRRREPQDGRPLDEDIARPDAVARVDALGRIEDRLARGEGLLEPLDVVVHGRRAGGVAVGPADVDGQLLRHVLREDPVLVADLDARDAALAGAGRELQA